MNIIFDKNEKVKAIDLATLRSTLTLSEYGGKPPISKPIEHHEFIDIIGDKLTSKNHIFDLDPIYISKTETKRIMLLDPKNENTPESHLIQRLVTKINLRDPGYQNTDHNMAIAIGYTEAGLQVSFGANVRICSNMSIFGGRYLQTYGGNKIPFSKMIELIDKYIGDLPEICDHDFRMLSAMRDVSLSPDHVMETIGDLNLRAYSGAYHKQFSPLSVTQVGAVTKRILDDSLEILTPEIARNVSLYDFYNHGTAALHPKYANDTSNIWQDTSNWGDYICNRFNLN